MIQKQTSTALKKFLIRTTSPAMRRQMLAVWEQAQDFTSYWRKSLALEGALPDFIIIGAQKCGTTYLYDQIVQHPGVTGARTKEIHFFDAYYRRGLGWYRAFFPRKRAGGAAGDFLTGEASPSYLFHPHTAGRARQAVPQAKLIAILRNPVDRAYSHYHHEVRLGYEALSFEDALAQENRRVAGELERMLADDSYHSHHYMHFAYKKKGAYVDQVRHWRQFFSADQMLVLRSDDLYRDTAATVSRVYAFLGLPDWQPAAREKHKVFAYPKMAPQTRQQLLEYFAPHNQRLYDYLGEDYGWNS